MEKTLVKSIRLRENKEPHLIEYFSKPNYATLIRNVFSDVEIVKKALHEYALTTDNTIERDKAYSVYCDIVKYEK